MALSCWIGADFIAILTSFSSICMNEVRRCIPKDERQSLQQRNEQGLQKSQSQGFLLEIQLNLRVEGVACLVR